MKTLILAFGLALAATSQAATHEHSQHQASPAAAAIHQGSGMLKAVNAKDSKVQIAHEPIAELGWPAMAMWFTLRAPIPQDLKVGDSVHFEIQQNDNKQWAIIKIGRK